MATLDDNNALLLFRVGPVRCCAPSLPVESIISPPQLTRPPGSSIARPGIFKHGKQLVSVMDLRYLFGVEKTDWKTGRNIITRLENRSAGFWVDEILDVIEMPAQGWGNTLSLIPREIFSRSLLLDEKIFLYSEFEQLAKIRQPGILKKYIEQLAEKQRPDKSPSQGEKRIIPPVSSKSKNSTAADNRTGGTSSLRENNEKFTHSEIKTGKSHHRHEKPSSPASKKILEADPEKKSKKTETRVNDTAHQPYISQPGNSDLHGKPDTRPVKAIPATGDTEIIAASPALTHHNKQTRAPSSFRKIHPRSTSPSLQPSASSKPDASLDPAGRSVETKRVIRKITTNTTRSASRQDDNPASIGWVILILLTLAGGAGYFVYAQFLSPTIQAERIPKIKLAQNEKLNTENSGLAGSNKNMEQTSNLVVDATNPDVAQQIYTSEVEQNTEFHEETGLFETKQVALEKTNMPETVEPPQDSSGESTEKTENHGTREDTPYRAEIMRRGNDITIVLHDTEDNSSQNTGAKGTGAAPEKERLPSPDENPDESEVTAISSVPGSLPATSGLTRDDTADTEEAVEVEIFSNEDKSGNIIQDKSAKTHKLFSTKHRRVEIVHIVVKGDTLWAIAKRYVNNPFRYPELARLSKIRNPDLIYPGNKVHIIKYMKQ